MKPKIIVQGIVVVLAKGRNGSGSTLSLLAVKVTVGTLIIQMEPTSKEIYKKLILSLIISVLGYVFLNKYIARIKPIPKAMHIYLVLLLKTWTLVPSTSTLVGAIKTINKKLLIPFNSPSHHSLSSTFSLS